MLCSDCKKNNAVIFVTEKDKDGNDIKKGYCYSCAKKRGITIGNISDINNLSSQDLSTLENQLSDAISNLAKNFPIGEINIDNIGGINGLYNNDDSDNDNNNDNGDSNDDDNSADGVDGFNSSSPIGFAIPLGSIFSGINNTNQNSKLQNSKNSESSNSSKGTTQTKTKNNNKKRKFLNTFGTNLTDKARKGEIDRVIGREAEIARVIEILNRRTKNNPCLIGEPGVGKTAIAQGLALRIAEGNVPAKLLKKEVYLLDMTSIVAGTQFRGQFEARMESIIKECKNDGNIILVIDEIHNIIGAGDSDHTMNAANILKPSLADGSIQLIGTTTINEYRKYIEKDSALERRFQSVMVEEPSIADTIKIIEGIKQYYEDYHKVKISNDVIVKLVNMSEKYIHNRYLPDKAIDVLDEACSKLNLKNKDLYNLETLKNQLKEVQAEKVKAADADSTDDYKKAAELKMQECNLTEQIEKIEKNMKPTILTVEDIAKVIENWTKIPVQKLTEAETDKLVHLEDHLHQRIIGQNEAVDAVARAIRRNRAGLRSTKRPPSFIFVGPTGVGKTELAKTLAAEMFGSEESIIRIDMSEYMESNSTAKLIGAPPGYVGYDNAGQLTEKVKRHPYSIVLLDEIEKAHPDVFNILLQVLDDGRLTDAQGNTVSFENTIIIMTSNVGSNENMNSIGFGSVNQQKKEKIMSSLEQTFRPEFLNRVDEIVVFNPLNHDELSKIVDLMLADTQKALDDRDIKMTVTAKAKQHLLEIGTNIKYGARPLRRTIERYIEDPLSEKILKGELSNGQNITIDYDSKELVFKD